MARPSEPQGDCSTSAKSPIRATVKSSCGIQAFGDLGRLFITSGYWGPAFNETGAQCEDGTAAYGAYEHRATNAHRCGRIFITAWCDGMRGEPLDRTRECYADVDIP